MTDAETRDHFAGQIFGAYVGHARFEIDSFDVRIIADASYELADVLMAARVGVLEPETAARRAQHNKKMLEIELARHAAQLIPAPSFVPGVSRDNGRGFG